MQLYFVTLGNLSKSLIENSMIYISIYIKQNGDARLSKW